MEESQLAKMSSEKQNAALQKVMTSELNSRVNQVKEEIRSTFARHRKSLSSRESWLVDQLDSIKDGTLAAVFKQQISLAEVKAKLEECVAFSQFSKEREFIEGTEHAVKVAESLCEKAEECQQVQQDSIIPSIKFVHDRAQLRNSILSYGTLEVEDDSDSCATDRSWDLVDEKVEAELGDKNARNRCCEGNTTCYQQMEIEDMDFSKLLAEDDLPLMSDNALKNVCKANELCNNICECVCFPPCPVANKASKVLDVDPVSELQKKFTNIYKSQDVVPQQPVDKNDMPSTTKITQSPFSADFTDTSDPLLQISAAVQSILSTPNSDGKNAGTSDCVSDLHTKLQGMLDGDEKPDEVEESEKLSADSKCDDSNRVGYTDLPWECSGKKSSKGRNSCGLFNDPPKVTRDFIDDLHLKLQGIIHGDLSQDQTKQPEMLLADMKHDASDRVEYKSLSWQNAEAKSSQNPDDVVSGLRSRLATIYQKGMKEEMISQVASQQPTFESDPVAALSSKFQEILAC